MAALAPEEAKVKYRLAHPRTCGHAERDARGDYKEKCRRPSAKPYLREWPAASPGGQGLTVIMGRCAAHPPEEGLGAEETTWEYVAAAEVHEG